MSLLEQASLVVTPNSYKESKLYSVIPNTTLGDMDVVRATTATRVNEQGLIEVVPRNLLTYSEQFANGVYITTDSTITANTSISPNGTTTADTLTEGITNDLHRIRQNFNVIIGNVYTLSVFCKAGSGTRNLGRAEVKTCSGPLHRSTRRRRRSSIHHHAG